MFSRDLGKPNELPRFRLQQRARLTSYLESERIYMRCTYARHALLAFFILSTSALCGQDAAIVLGKDKIPPGYEAYSLFLIPSTDWQNNTDELGRLRTAFNDFG